MLYALRLEQANKRRRVLVLCWAVSCEGFCACVGSDFLETLWKLAIRGPPCTPSFVERKSKNCAQISARCCKASLSNLV